MQFISNQKKPNHHKRITELIEGADEIMIATAFLKTSGLDRILPSLKRVVRQGKSVSIIAGQHFALTEPDALRTIRKIFLSKTNCKLHIAHALKPKEVFHPKLFLFRTGKTFTLLSGSANVTEGGLSSNIECSLFVSGTIQDNVWRDVTEFFSLLFSQRMSEEATLLAIRRYESFYEAQKSHNKKSKAIPQRKKRQLDFNYIKLREHFRRFNTARRRELFAERQLDYEGARNVLNSIADTPRLTQAIFAPLLDELVGREGEDRWWHSGSLFRLRRKVYPYYQEFQELVRFVRDNIHLSPSLLFTAAKELVGPIEGASVNYITEIMMTYDSQRFANLNKNPITVLRDEGDVYLKASAASLDGDDYEEYCELIAEICRELGLHNMLEADSFFNDIYWEIYKRRR